ncbi:MAG: MCP four helix bundle domain-containing protein [Clostridiales bacterium]|nr:MCP four helix bundle domain-containing protein [Clostridiales bacterium]
MSKLFSRFRLSVVLIVILTICITCAAIFIVIQLSSESEEGYVTVSKPLENIINFSLYFNQMRTAETGLVNSDQPEESYKQAETLKETLSKMNELIDQYVEAIKANPGSYSEAEAESVDRINEILSDYTEIITDDLIPLGIANNIDGADGIINDSLAKSENEIKHQMKNLISSSNLYELDYLSASAKIESITISLILGVISAIFLLSVFIKTRLFSKPPLQQDYKDSDA